MWAIRTTEGKKRKTYSVRWIVGGQEQHDTFATFALADAFRAKLIGYQQKGAAFDLATGLPEPMLRELNAQSWFSHVLAYTSMKWENSSPNSRKSMADTLATVTPALVRQDRNPPPTAELRLAVWSWLARPPARSAGGPPPEVRDALRWLERNSIALADLEDRTTGPELVRAALNALARKTTGGKAMPNTVARRRAVFFNSLGYAVELGRLATNPIDTVAWRSAKAVETVDRRVVVNPDQAERLLAAVGEQGEMGARLVAFFALIYYAATRPAEAIGLDERGLSRLPASGWGELLLSRSVPRSGVAWSNTGRSREVRGLKHRAEADIRPVPAHPRLVAHLHRHVDRYGFAPDGRLLHGPRGGQINESSYLPVWSKARAAVFSPAELASPLARRPYDLRHAAVSTWLNAGVPATQVAEWAGQSVEVLLRVYAKCIAGQAEQALGRIEQATGLTGPEADVFLRSNDRQEPETGA
ncbi:tyrosine-type recombinase/integrase [Catellatospora methionotrophica]|uniref:tyrosine-type recombinase/integrase n=1 Tax=Catellatospora methionotrophica TaxID=121620 RepID=UPI001EF324DF|nr:hypothetical protein [Catellatospora methionotrophica]